MQAAGRPLAAAEMVLVRIAYAADLPTPDEVIRSLGEGGEAGCPPAGQWRRRPPRRRRASRPRGDAPRGSPRSSARGIAAHGRSDRRSQPARAAPTLSINSFDELIALAAEKRDIRRKVALERDVRLVRCEDGRLEIALEARRAEDAGRTICRASSRQWTGRRWMVVVSEEEGAPTLRAQADERQADARARRRADPLVQAVLERFPGAEDRRRATATRGAGDARIELPAGDQSESETRLMADFMGMMKQAAELQTKMEEMQAELDRIEVEGTAGGGLVTVTLTGKGEMKGVKIDDSLFKPRTRKSSRT